MNQLIKMDEEYRKWIEDIGKRYKQRQIKASVSVNQEMIGFYWSIGKDIDFSLSNLHLSMIAL